MWTTRLKRIIALLFLVVAPGLALAAEPTLKVGDPAPKLQTGRWMQGEPVNQFEKGKAYLLEFWATTSGPCRDSIPHLNDIYTEYKDKGLVVIGQDCSERDESLVAPFIEKMGARMAYRVALDDKSGGPTGKMAETWMAAAGRNSIPSAFLVDKTGILAWIGHPMELKEKVIEEVLAGTFDVKKAAAEYDQRAKNETRLRAVWAEFNATKREKNWDAAAASLGEAEKLMPADNHSAVDMARFDLLILKKDFAAAYKVAASFSDANRENTLLQNELAWRIATDKTIEQRDLALAERLATRANEAAKGNEPGVLDTLARVLYLQGKREQAVATELSLPKAARKRRCKRWSRVIGKACCRLRSDPESGSG